MSPPCCGLCSAGGKGRLRSPAGNQNTWDGRAKDGARHPGHRGTAVGMGMPEGAAGFGTSGYPLSSALRGGHGSPPPAQAGWVGDAASQPSHNGVGQPSLGWSHQLSLGGWLSTLHHGQQQSCRVPGGSCHPLCPLRWRQCPGVDQRRGRTSPWGEGPRTPIVLEPLASAPCPRTEGQPGMGTGDSRLFSSIAGSESQRSRNPSVPPSTAEPHWAPNTPALACSAPLPPRLCWHGSANEAGLIGSCVCGQSVMKRFSVSLCKLP